MAGWRPLTEQEIKDFRVIPEGAIIISDYESYQAAVNTLIEKKVHFHAGCNRDEGLFWTKEIGRE